MQEGFNGYLEETKMLDYSHKDIQNLVRERKWSDFPEKKRVKEIYNFVKDELDFARITNSLKRERIFPFLYRVLLVEANSKNKQVKEVLS